MNKFIIKLILFYFIALPLYSEEKLIDIYPEISGIVEKINFKEGDVVSPGETIIELYSSHICNWRNSTIDEEKIELKNFESKLSQSELLYDAGAISLEKVDKVKIDFQNLKLIVKELERRDSEKNIWKSKHSITSSYFARIKKVHVGVEKKEDFVDSKTKLLTLKIISEEEYKKGKRLATLTAP